MGDYDDPMTLCSDCCYRAKGMNTTKPIDDGPRECEWCGDEVSSPVRIVERQEDPGPMEWQVARDELFDWLEEQDHLTDIRRTDKSIDFTVGHYLDDWPDYTADDELNAIRSSSVSMGFVLGDEKPFEDAKLHLPPAPEELRDEIEASLDLPDQFGIHYGTGAAGGMPAPDGVVTPHILATDDASPEEVRQVVEQMIEVFVEIYKTGDNAIKVKP